MSINVGVLIARRRLFAVLLFASIIGVLLLVDRSIARTKKQEIVVSDQSLGPIASPVSTRSSLWFCASGQTQTGDLVLTISNPTNEPAKGTISFVGDESQRGSIVVDLGPGERRDISTRASLVANNVGATVEFDHGGLVVEHRIVSGDQVSSAPCATSASDNWYFPDGSTVRTAQTMLSVLNPFAEDAVIDIAVSTERGLARPVELQGVSIPAASIRLIDIGSYVRRRTAIATYVHSIVGRTVTEEIFHVDGHGTTLLTGAPALGAQWYFPAGQTSATLRERYALYNPTGKDITAKIDVLIDGADAEPFDVEVPARSRIDFIPSAETRIPREVGYSVFVESTEKTLAVSRVLDARGGQRHGLAATLGAQRVANQWIIGDVVASADRDDQISVLNPSDTPTVVKLFRLVPGAEPETIKGTEDLVVDSLGRLDIRIADFVSDPGSAVIVQSQSAPIVVEHARTSVLRREARALRPFYPTVANGASAVDENGNPTATEVSSTDGSTTDPLPDATQPVAMSVATSSPTAPVDTPVGGRAGLFSVGFVASISNQATATVRAPAATALPTATPASTAAAAAILATTIPAATTPATTKPAAPTSATTTPATTTPATTTPAVTTLDVTAPTTTKPIVTTPGAPVSSSSSSSLSTNTEAVTDTVGPVVTEQLSVAEQAAPRMALGVVRRAGPNTSSAMATPLPGAGVVR